jgi:hypothetical protein
MEATARFPPVPIRKRVLSTAPVAGTSRNRDKCGPAISACTSRDHALSNPSPSLRHGVALTKGVAWISSKRNNAMGLASMMQKAQPREILPANHLGPRNGVAAKAAHFESLTFATRANEDISAPAATEPVWGRPGRDRFLTARPLPRSTRAAENRPAPPPTAFPLQKEKHPVSAGKCGVPTQEVMPMIPSSPGRFHRISGNPARSP